MLVNGEKWACETCIKGHRATHCKHTDRELIHVKRKGRPSTQCQRCKELRTIRQLHVKCDCNEKGDNKKATTATNTLPDVKINKVLRKKQRSKALRPIAPKQKDILNSCHSNDSCHSNKQSLSKQIDQNATLPSPPAVLQPYVSLSIPVSLQSSLLTPTPLSTSVQPTITPLYPTTSSPNKTHNSKPSCCSKKTSCSKQPLSDTDLTLSSSSDEEPSSTVESVPLPHIPPPTSCCGPPSKNQQGEIIRVVTCRCGDSCACIGCDAHPSRAMKEGKNDVYVGFDGRKRLSISSMTLSRNDQTQQEPSSVLIENGVSFCGCGCSKPFEECSGCFQGFLCQDYH